MARDMQPLRVASATAQSHPPALRDVGRLHSWQLQLTVGRAEVSQAWEPPTSSSTIWEPARNAILGVYPRNSAACFNQPS